MGRKFFTVSITLVALVSIGAATHFYLETQKLKKDPQANVHEEAADVITEVGKLIILPEGETPTVATVTDPKALADQPFFKGAQVGDKVLLYTKAGKAYLYDPTKKKLRGVAPLNTSAAPQAANTAGIPPTTP